MAKGFVFKSGIRVSNMHVYVNAWRIFTDKTVRENTILDQLFEAVALRVSSKYHAFVSSLCLFS